MTTNDSDNCNEHQRSDGAGPGVVRRGSRLLAHLIHRISLFGENLGCRESDLPKAPPQDPGPHPKAHFRSCCVFPMVSTTMGPLPLTRISSIAGHFGLPGAGSSMVNLRTGDGFQGPHASAGCRGRRGQQNHHRPFTDASVPMGQCSRGQCGVGSSSPLLTTIRCGHTRPILEVTWDVLGGTAWAGEQTIHSLKPGSAPSYGTYQLGAKGDIVSIRAVPPCWLRVEGRHGGSGLATGQDHRETGDVWSTGLWLAGPWGIHCSLTNASKCSWTFGGSGCNGSVCGPLCPTACAELTLDASTKSASFDLDNGQRGKRYRKYFTDEHTEAGEVSNLPKVEHPVSGRAGIRLGVCLESPD